MQGSGLVAACHTAGFCSVAPKSSSNMVRQESTLKKLRVPLMQLPHGLLENSCK